jgi:gluconate kinase
MNSQITRPQNKSRFTNQEPETKRKRFQLLRVLRALNFQLLKTSLSRKSSSKSTRKNHLLKSQKIPSQFTNLLKWSRKLSSNLMRVRKLSIQSSLPHLKVRKEKSNSWRSNFLFFRINFLDGKTHSLMMNAE